MSSISSRRAYVATGNRLANPITVTSKRDSFIDIVRAFLVKFVR